MRLLVDVGVRRGSVVESRHRLQAVVVRPGGEIVAETADSGLVTTFRSSAKPFQLLALVERGHADRWGWTDEQLAIMAASHVGSAYHVERVTEILSRMELSDRDLECGFHEPSDPESRTRVMSGAAPRSPLFNNCSGKHAGMLCLARSEGWPTAGYIRPDHPVQQLMHANVAEVCGLSPDSVAVGVDACGVSTFGMPLTAMARAYARLASARPESGTRAAALARIRDAMGRFPRAVGGAGQLSTELMSVTSGRLVSKGGAEGLECTASIEQGWGMALKCEDGHSRPLAPAAIALLEHLGALSSHEVESLAALARPILRTHVGLEVGALQATVRVLSPAPL